MMGCWKILTALMLCGCVGSPPLRTVSEVDLERYAGKWHEIARYPNWFQRSCTGAVTAEYRPMAGGKVAVLNQCVRRDGSIESASGRATVVPGSGNARLKVSFGGPFAGDYWIICLDPLYQWALVGHPSRQYLWILARLPKLNAKLYERIVQAAVDQGYDSRRIVRTPAR